MVAFEVLSKICQQHGDELTDSAAGTFPRVDPSTTVWAQCNSNALIQDWDERANSSSPAMSAMFAVMKMFYTRPDTRDFWQESYTTCWDKLMRAKAAQRKLRKCVCKHNKAASEARWETDQAYVALGNLHTQIEQVDQQRAVAQEARADDQAVLARLQEQLEATHAKAFIATCQWIIANNRAAMAKAK